MKNIKLFKFINKSYFLNVKPKFNGFNFTMSKRFKSVPYLWALTTLEKE